MSKLLNEYDYASIHAQAGVMMKERKHLKQSAIDRYMDYFNTKCVKSKAETERAKKIIPPEKGSDFCHRLVNHGREVCTARTTPHCERCCLSDICRYAQEEKSGKAEK